MKKLVFGHHPCIDGVAAMWAVEQGFEGQDISSYGMSYANQGQHAAQIRNVLERESGRQPADVYFVDYLPNDTQIIQHLLDEGHRVTILDHHQTAEHNLAEVLEANPDHPNLKAVFDYRFSGGKIAWNTLCPNRPTPEILDLVDRMDLLRLEGMEEEKAAAYIDSFPLHDNARLNIEQFSKFHEVIEREGISGLAALGEAVWQEEVHRVDALLEGKKDITIGDEVYPSVKVHDITDLGRVGVTRMAEALTSYETPVGLLVKQTKNIVSVSIRVHPDFGDCTHDVVESLKDAALAVATETEQAKISGGGRGSNGQIGQGVVRMPPAVAARLGVVDPLKDVGQHQQRGKG